MDLNGLEYVIAVGFTILNHFSWKSSVREVLSKVMLYKAIH